MSASPRREFGRDVAVLLPRSPARRPGPRTPVSARPVGDDRRPHDRSGQGLRSAAAAGTGGRGLPGDGRAPRDQDAVAPMTEMDSSLTLVIELSDAAASSAYDSLYTRFSDQFGGI